MAVIYRITNMANDHYYIGSAESFERRKWQHTYALRRGEHKNPRLQAAWNKYGADMFVFEVLEEVSKDRTAFDIENTYLMKCVGNPDCYNINTDAVGMRTGIPHTEASKAKLSKSRKGKAAGASHYRYGKTLSDEVKAKIGNTQRGKPKAPRKVSEEGRAKIRANIEAGRSHMHWVGKKHTEASKEKMMRPILATLPDASTRQFRGLSEASVELTVFLPTLIRACKSGKAVSKGPLKGWRFEYVDKDSLGVYKPS